MDVIFQMVVQYVAEIVALIVISAIGILGTYILNKINKNKKLENIGVATEQLITATQATVRRLQQTLVEAYKEASPDGKLAPEQIAELKTKVQLITLEQLAQPTIDLLIAAKIDVEGMIANAAEAYINKMKQEGIF